MMIVKEIDPKVAETKCTSDNGLSYVAWEVSTDGRKPVTVLVYGTGPTEDMTKIGRLLEIAATYDKVMLALPMSSQIMTSQESAS